RVVVLDGMTRLAIVLGRAGREVLRQATGALLQEALLLGDLELHAAVSRESLGGGAWSGCGQRRRRRRCGAARSGRETQACGRELRIERVPDPVAQEIEREDGHGDGQPWKQDQPPLRYEARDRVRQHVAPGGGGWWDADAEKPQSGLDDDRHSEMRGREHEV